MIAVESNIYYSSEIPENSLSCMLILVGVYVLRDLVHMECYIWACEGKVLRGADKLAVGNGITGRDII